MKTKERFPANSSIGERIGKRALANGSHWLAFGPALIVTSEQLDEMLAVLDRSAGEVLGRSVFVGRVESSRPAVYD